MYLKQEHYKTESKRIIREIWLWCLIHFLLGEFNHHIMRTLKWPMKKPLKGGSETWKHNITICKTDSQWEFSVWLRELKLVLCDSLGNGNHSSTFAWKIPWTEEPGRPQSMGLLRVGHDWAASLLLFTFKNWRRKWQPTPVFLPGESQGRGSLVGCRLWGRTESDTTEAT